MTAPARSRTGLYTSFAPDLLLMDLRVALARQGRTTDLVGAYGQIAEKLTLSRAGSEPGDADLVVIRPDDALRADDDPPAYRYSAKADAWLDTVAGAIEQHREAAALLCCCIAPSCGEVTGDPDLRAWASRAARILTERAAVAGAILVEGPSGRCCDPFMDTLAHIPYRREWILGLAAMLARAAFGRLVPVTKVIAVDCDNTLWGGECGVLGPQGVDTAGPWQEVHALLAEQARSGRLVCLVSHNVPDDVQRVLDSGRLGLSSSDITSAKISWAPKPALISELSAQFGLALDSFLFLDDDPMQRELVRTQLPQVLVPDFSSPAEFAEVIRGGWTLGTGGVTAEATERGRRYRQEETRRCARAEYMLPEDFLRQLGVVVSFAPLTASTTPRAWQLLQRVTQFRAVAADFDGFEERAACAWGRTWVVEVEDRLGDYGRVGLLADRKAGSVLHVDVALLSCRVLERGVEDALLSRIRQDATELDCSSVEFRMVQTSRNVPAQAWLRAIARGDPGHDGDQLTVRVPRQDLVTPVSGLVLPQIRELGPSAR